MADIRETLIKLLYQAPCESELEEKPGSCQYRRNGKCGEIDRMDYCAVSHLADHLIANGVTVQEWISVTERYPDEAGFYMGFYEARPGYWRVSTLHWSGENWNNIGYIPPSVYCTHWMPLPQPPKGE